MVRLSIWRWAKMQDRAAGRFIHAAALHADEAVLHHVHAAHAVLAAELVQRLHHLQSASMRLAVHGHAVAVFKDSSCARLPALSRGVFGKHGAAW